MSRDLISHFYCHDYAKKETTDYDGRFDHDDEDSCSCFQRIRELLITPEPSTLWCASVIQW